MIALHIRVKAALLLLMACSGLSCSGNSGLPTTSSTGPSVGANTGTEVSNPRIRISKETTYLEGPLTDDGYVDYIAAMDERLSEGVTPENNAAVLLWQCWGPRGLSAVNQEEFFARLGMDVPPVEGSYFLTPYEYEHNIVPGLGDQPGIDASGQISDMARGEPWTAADFPSIAEWLAAQEKPLAIAVEATRRPRYYQPVIAGDPPVLNATPLEGVREFRLASLALVVRALLAIGEGELDAAWRDILAVRRMARLIAQGFSQFEGLVGIALDGMACSAAQQLLRRFALTADQARAMERELRALPLLPSMAHKEDVGQRCGQLDLTIAIARYSPRRVALLLNDAPPDKDPLLAMSSALSALTIDWDEALMQTNDWHNRLVAAARVPTFAERDKELAMIEEELDRLTSSHVRRLANFARSGKQDGNVSEGWGSAVGTLLTGIYRPAFRTMCKSEDRQAMNFDITRIGFALAGYKADHGEYPDSLNVLAPGFIPELPLDRFIDKSLLYVKTDDGYVLYSVGPNMADDGGNDEKSQTPADDIVLRISSRHKP